MLFYLLTANLNILVYDSNPHKEIAAERTLIAA